MDFAQALRALDERIPTRMVPDLDRMRALSELLDQPQRTYPSIHVTGTNGKTTTAWVASELLRAIGLSVGTYTSPHLHHVRERIAHGGEPISEQEFAESYAYLEPFLADVDARGERVTYFETLTMLAESWFAERAVDVAVVEVGMGGEWDATNLVDGRVAVITEVAVDHPELGTTSVEIAREKVGIIKQAAVCITAERSAEVRAVIEERCVEMGAILRVDGTDFALYGRDNAVGGQALDLSVPGATFEQVFVPLYGERMATDVLLGLAAVSAFLGDRPLDADLVRDALGKVRSPGRIEVLGRRPLVIVDGAHNPAAADELAMTIQESFSHDRLVLVLGMLGDKDVAGVAGALVPTADVVVATTPASPRAAPPERIAKEAANLGADVRVASTVATAVAQAIDLAGERDCVLIAGSFVTAGEAREVVLGL
ncbi:MAG: bifunctional folylpolyglutamate synthase/dihydrofolate synthase [Actinomycetota bacterium]